MAEITTLWVSRKIRISKIRQIYKYWYMNLFGASRDKHILGKKGKSECILWKIYKFQK